MKLSPVRTRQVLTQVNVEGQNYDVYVAVDRAEYKTVDDIKNAEIASPLGTKVRIGDVAAIEEGTSPNSITRDDGRMVVTVSGDITEKDVAKVSSGFLKKVDQAQKPATVEVKTGGVTEH